jgi:sugar-specific transcriptional regulator TrmB
MTSPFRRFRERTLSRERLVDSQKEDANHHQAADSCEKVKGVGSSIREEEGNAIFSSHSRGDRSALNCFYTRFKSKRRKTL